MLAFLSHNRSIVKIYKPESPILTSCPANPWTVNTFPYLWHQMTISRPSPHHRSHYGAFRHKARILNELAHHKVVQPPSRMRLGNSPWLWPSHTFAIHHLAFSASQTHHHHHRHFFVITTTQTQAVMFASGSEWRAIQWLAACCCRWSRALHWSATGTNMRWKPHPKHRLWRPPGYGYTTQRTLHYRLRVWTCKWEYIWILNAKWH